MPKAPWLYLLVVALIGANILIYYQCTSEAENSRVNSGDETRSSNSKDQPITDAAAPASTIGEASHKPVEVHSYWSGPVDEALLLCWHNNLLNPDVHQIFHLDDTRGWHEATQKYPFLQQVETRPIDWPSFIRGMGIPFHEPLIRRIPGLEVNTRSDIFRYVMMFLLDSFFYIDSDVCLFNLRGPMLDLREQEFLVAEKADRTLVANSAFHLHAHLSTARNFLAREFLAKGTIGKLSPGRDPWGIIGPDFFDRMVSAIPKRSYPEEVPRDDPVVYLSVAYGYGWEWHEEHRKICDVWERQMKLQRMGIHLWTNRRKQYREDLLQLTSWAFERDEVPSECHFAF